MCYPYSTGDGYGGSYTGDPDDNTLENGLKTAAGAVVVGGIIHYLDSGSKTTSVTKPPITTQPKMYKCPNGLYSSTGQQGCFTKCPNGLYVTKGTSCPSTSAP